MKRVKPLIILITFIILSLCSIGYLFISAFNQVNEEINTDLHHKIAWEVAKIVKYGEIENLRDYLVTFDTEHFYQIKMDRIMINMALSVNPKYRPSYEITTSKDLYDDITIHSGNVIHQFSVFINPKLWLNVNISKNYKYFFITIAAQIGTIILISLLLCVSCILFYRMYLITKYSKKFMLQLGIPSTPSLYENLLSGPMELFQQMQTRINNLTSTRVRLLSSISHDLKTPLSRIRFRMDRIDSQNLPKIKDTINDLDEIANIINNDHSTMYDIKTVLAKIQTRMEKIKIANFPEIQKTLKDVDEISSVIGEFLTLSQLTPQTMRKVDLNQTLLTIQDNYADQGHNIQYSDINKPVVLLGSSQIFNRIFCNIINNSLRFANEIEMQIILTKKLITIIISDNGPGVPSEILPKLITAGFQQHANKYSKNYGLGLAIVHELISQTGGKVTFENKKPNGLEVTFFWPVNK